MQGTKFSEAGEKFTHIFTPIIYEAAKKLTEANGFKDGVYYVDLLRECDS